MSDKANGLTEAELRELATRGAAELEGANATDLLHWTDEHFGGILAQTDVLMPNEAEALRISGDCRGSAAGTGTG